MNRHSGVVDLDSRDGKHADIAMGGLIFARDRGESAMRVYCTLLVREQTAPQLKHQDVQDGGEGFGPLAEPDVNRARVFQRGPHSVPQAPGSTVPYPGHVHHGDLPRDTGKPQEGEQRW